MYEYAASMHLILASTYLWAVPNKTKGADIPFLMQIKRQTQKTFPATTVNAPAIGAETQGDTTKADNKPDK